MELDKGYLLVPQEWTGRGSAQSEADPSSLSKQEINSPLFIDVPSLTDSPAAQGVWAESHHSKNVTEIWSRAGEWTQISQSQQADDPFSLCFKVK